MNRSDLENNLQLQSALALRESGIGLSSYLDHVVVNSSPEPRRFSLIREPWQTSLFSQVDKALADVSRIKTGYNGPRRFWITLPRGHDKTSGIARRLNFLLSFSKRRLHCATAAMDGDQAGLISESMEAEALLNPWLGELLSIRKERAYGPGGTLKILTADAPSSFGLNCDVIVVDELTHWEDRALWDVLISGAAKRRGAVVLVISNAGINGTWQHKIWKQIQTDPLWWTFSSPERVRLAQWMSEEQIASDRKTLPPGMAKRVYDNIWIDPGEESGYLTRPEILPCVDSTLRRTDRGNPGQEYVAGIDYGPKRDRTALCILHFTTDQKILVDELTVWQGSPDSPIPVARVENWIEEVNQRYNRPVLVFDPYQMEALAQKYEYHQKVERHEARGGKANFEMAANLREFLVNHRLRWYPGAGDLLVEGQIESFVDELSGLIVVETSYGYRFDHKADFHDDRAVAVGMAALVAARRGPHPGWVAPQTPKKPEKTPMTPLIIQDRGRVGVWGIRG